MAAPAEMKAPNCVAILCGGGPAPGMNSVIGAAVIRCELAKVRVLGIADGFSNLMRGYDHMMAGHYFQELTISMVSRVHFRGGSILGTSRANPSKKEGDIKKVVDTLLKMGVDCLVTIGGDDTCFSSMNIAKHPDARGKLRLVHVPKTIDNDLNLPPEIDTFGFQTARHVGVEVVKNLLVDARTTSRWYFCIAMGRKAGHLALGIGKAAGATLTMIPEEFNGEIVPLSFIVDTLVGAVVKRAAEGRQDGVAVIAEGLFDMLDPKELADLGELELDEFGHVRMAEVPLGDILKRRVREALKDLGINVTIVSKDIGYELRCADPIPFDMEYCRDLGYCAAKYLIEGGSDVMVSMQGGKFVPIPYSEMLDEKKGHTKVRTVDINSTRYAIARRYMIRVRRDDFTEAHVNELAHLAKTAKMTPEAFAARFKPLTKYEPPHLSLYHPM